MSLHQLGGFLQSEPYQSLLYSGAAMRVRLWRKTLLTTQQRVCRTIAECVPMAAARPVCVVMMHDLTHTNWLRWWALASAPSFLASTQATSGKLWMQDCSLPR